MPRPKKPRHLSEAEFQLVFKEVRADINELQLHNKVFSGVIEHLGRYPRLGINFPAFFGAFLAAMRTDLVIRLGRIYDPEGTGHDSCTLARCISALRDNAQFFTDTAITARLTEGYREANPSFLSSHHADLKQVDADITRIVKSRKRLIRLRHKVYAHKDLETVLTGKRDEFLSSHEEVKELIQIAHEIWNRYSKMWSASTYSDKTIGEDDYKWLFSYLRRGMKVKSLLDDRQFERSRRRTERVNAVHSLDDAKLTDYCETFLGFGQVNAPIWFVGTEEAGGWTIGDVERRLWAWNDRRRQSFEDAPVFYPLCGNQRWHGEGAVSQDTWRQLIRMLLIARSQNISARAILDYQRTQWGTLAGNTCLAELLPLPSPSTGDWNYGQWSGLSWLRSRDDYLARVRAGRENELRLRIMTHQPRVVIFYGLELPTDVSLLPSWSSIASGRFVQAFEDKEILLMRETANTTFYVTRHPRAESDDYFHEIGLFLRRKHGNQI